MASSDLQAVRAIIASSLDWQEAHATFDAAVANFPAQLRGKRPPDFPHSGWELLEHIRIAQEDLADFMERADYHVIKWPDDYWPKSPEPPSEAAWDESIAAVLRDREHIKEIAMRPSIDLAAKIPWGTGQTYLRTVLVAVDHTAYHVGQIIAVRRLLGAWP
ncbi:MAG TPA: DinB family protein [Gemmatimonadaceae bacterium]